MNHHVQQPCQVSQAAREMIIYWAKQARKRLKRRRLPGLPGATAMAGLEMMGHGYARPIGFNRYSWCIRNFTILLNYT